MPVRNICIYTTIVQLFSFITFISFWNIPQYGDLRIKRNISFINNANDNNNNNNNIAVVHSGKNQGTSFQGLHRNSLAAFCNPDPNVDDLCSNLVTGSIKDYQSIVQARFNARRRLTSCRLSELLKDCEKLLTAHEYLHKPISKLEEDFPLAFAIKMHKDPEQAEQLLRTIYRPHNVYCLYVDAKAHPIIYNTMLNVSKCLPNVHVIRDRINIVYSSFAHIHSELQCMRKCLESNVTWKYYINLAGQEFPLKTNLEMVMILKSLNGANDIESYNHPVFMRWRFKKKYKRDNFSIVETNEKKEPFKYDIQMSKGSAYGAFTRKFVEFVLSDDIAKSFLSWLNNTYAPEENIWATLNTLPWAPGGYELETRHRFDTFLSRAVIWEDDKFKCEGRYVRSVCIFGAKDLSWLVSRPQLFANKFDSKMDSTSIDCLESFIRKRVFQKNVVSLHWYYYHNLPHARAYADLRNNLNNKTLHIRKAEWLKEQKISADRKKVYLKSRKEKSNELKVPSGTITMYKIHGRDAAQGMKIL